MEGFQERFSSGSKKLQRLSLTMFVHILNIYSFYFIQLCDSNICCASEYFLFSIFKEKTSLFVVSHVEYTSQEAFGQPVLIQSATERH